jgi:DNA-binding response OmpR family regulator
MSGAELQQLLIRRGVEIPIIFISADANEIAQQQVLDAGGAAFLGKPFNIESLLEKIRSVALLTLSLGPLHRPAPKYKASEPTYNFQVFDTLLLCFLSATSNTEGERDDVKAKKIYKDCTSRYGTSGRINNLFRTN